MLRVLAAACIACMTSELGLAQQGRQPHNGMRRTLYNIRDILSIDGGTHDWPEAPIDDLSAALKKAVLVELDEQDRIHGLSLIVREVKLRTRNAWIEGTKIEEREGYLVIEQSGDTHEQVGAILAEIRTCLGLEKGALPVPENMRLVTYDVRDTVARLRILPHTPLDSLSPALRERVDEEFCRLDPRPDPSALVSEIKRRTAGEWTAQSFIMLRHGRIGVIQTSVVQEKIAEILSEVRTGGMPRGSGSTAVVTDVPDTATNSRTGKGAGEPSRASAKEPLFPLPPSESSVNAEPERASALPERPAEGPALEPVPRDVASLAATPEEAQARPSGEGTKRTYFVVCLCAGLAVAAAGAWLLLRRRSGG